MPQKISGVRGLAPENLGKIPTCLLTNFKTVALSANQPAQFLAQRVALPASTADNSLEYFEHAVT